MNNISTFSTKMPFQLNGCSKLKFFERKFNNISTFFELDFYKMIIITKFLKAKFSPSLDFSTTLS